MTYLALAPCSNFYTSAIFVSLDLWLAIKRDLPVHFHPYMTLSWLFFSLLPSLIMCSVKPNQTKSKSSILLWFQLRKQTNKYDGILKGTTGMVTVAKCDPGDSNPEYSSKHAIISPVFTEYLIAQSLQITMENLPQAIISWVKLYQETNNKS